MQGKIVIKGAREHKLKSIDIELKISFSLRSNYRFNSSLPWKFVGVYAR